MESIDALATAIKEFEGGVVIVSHDFRACFPSSSSIFVVHKLIQRVRYTGLISQVAEELWEVANKTIINLTKKDISIVDYKKNLIRESASILSYLRAWRAGSLISFLFRSSRHRKGEVVQQDCAQGQDVNRSSSWKSSRGWLGYGLVPFNVFSCISTIVVSLSISR